MKLYMIRGVFYRDEKDSEDPGRTFAKGTIVEVPDAPKVIDDKNPIKPLTRFALGLIAQGRAREATEVDFEAAKLQARVQALKDKIAEEEAKQGIAEDDEEATLQARLAELTGGRKGKAAAGAAS